MGLRDVLTLMANVATQCQLVQVRNRAIRVLQVQHTRTDNGRPVGQRGYTPIRDNRT